VSDERLPNTTSEAHLVVSDKACAYRLHCFNTWSSPSLDRKSCQSRRSETHILRRRRGWILEDRTQLDDSTEQSFQERSNMRLVKESFDTLCQMSAHQRYACIDCGAEDVVQNVWLVLSTTYFVHEVG
jgi:hypothetical protein